MTSQTSTETTKRGFMSPPPPAERLPDAEVKKKYPRMRLQVFLGIFIGYAGFYLIRNNISLVTPLLESEGRLDKVGIGIIANAVLISYGLSKFFMATVSDRSNARLFMPIGLALSAVMNLIIGFIPAATASIGIFATVMFINGWFQGMGWPPSGRVLVHWFSTNERGWKTSIWNCAHNVGGAGVGAAAAAGLAMTGDKWQAAFWFPAVIALVVAAIAFFCIRDTPASVGLPPIEEYRDDPAKVVAVDPETQHMSYWQIIYKYVLTNRTMVFLALANVFVYALRYGVLNWTPAYLTEVRGQSMAAGIGGFSLFEIAGIIGTLLCGWVSDKVFKGYRTGAGVLFLGGVFVFTAAYWLLPQGAPVWVSYLLLALIGGSIYGPVMLIGLQAIDLSPSNIAGTAAGFTGLFGYVLGATMASTGVGILIEHFGWNVTFIVLLACVGLAIALMLGVGKDEKALIADQKRRADELHAAQGK